ncbi:S8 family serine peptidase [Grimontia sp. S25]|uniref:S8 family serine peptidase n=1 Tax=Grimontia sedimenti TaxID=2711294 RepID=A0A6M1RL54_9GAMM|nr:S8 family serine peptidase [Grimontia sedimenti]NGO00143.1 S8 family serine peptidase [Grimontia sedimenti]
MSGAASSNDWLVRVSPSFNAQPHLNAVTVYSFSNGDQLLGLDETSFEKAAKQLFSDDAVIYFEKAPEIISRKKPVARAFVKSQQQNFLENDGFKELTHSQRQCDMATIAILDSGVDIAHPAFNQVNFPDALDTITDTHTSDDPYGHGTHVAGLIAAQATQTFPELQGACTSATVYPIRFLDRFGGGTLKNAIQGIQWAIDNNAKIINHSWAIGSENQALLDVLTDANQRGIVQVAAAANAGRDLANSPYYPAAYSQRLGGLISVANWDNQTGNLYTLSNYGASSVDIAASGTDLLSSLPNNDSGTKTGTSMATPLVSATAAMILQQHPSLSAEEVKAQIIQNVAHEATLQQRVISGGRLKAKAAVTATPNEAFLHHSDTHENQLSVYGVNLHQINDWQYVTATSPSINTPILPESVSKESVTFLDFSMPVGWIEATTASGKRLSLLVKPELPAPAELELLNNNQDHIVTWRGTQFAETYEVEWRMPGKPYAEKAIVKAPANQFLLPVESSPAAIRIRALYTYSTDKEHLSVIDGQQASTFMEITLAQEQEDNLIDFGIVPQGIHIEFALTQLGFPQDADPYLTPSNSSQIVSAIENGLMLLNTETVGPLTSILEIADQQGAAIWQLRGQVESSQHWQLGLDTGDYVSIDPTGAALDVAFKQGGNYRLVLSTKPKESVILSLTQAAQTPQEIRSVTFDGKALDESNITVNGKTTSLLLSNDSEKETVSVSFTVGAPSDSQTTPASSDSRCFLATMAFSQSPLILDHLRFVRDYVIKPLPYGDTIVDAYYQHSPFWVVELQGNPWAILAIQVSILLSLYLLPGFFVVRFIKRTI